MNKKPTLSEFLKDYKGKAIIGAGIYVLLYSMKELLWTALAASILYNFVTIKSCSWDKNGFSSERDPIIIKK